VSLIGAGGMGEVYRAHDRKLNRHVALKVLPPVFAVDRERLARFNREAQLLASLNHSRIAAIYGLEESGAAPALVLELVEGSTLADRIAEGSLPFDEVIAIARQVAEALDAAHEHGIVHRDLKPANIKLTPDGGVKVLDFGLAKVVSPAGDDAERPDASNSPTITGAGTRAGMILGTASYMSPEQARGKAVDKRTDVWAFGCVLYEMLTGRRAFAGEEVSDTIVSILRDDPDWTALSGVPAGIVVLLRHCLDKDRSRRLRDVGDIRVWIDEALATPAGVAAATRPERTGRATWAAAIAAALVIVALAVPSYRYFRLDPPEARVTRFEILTPPTTAPFSFAVSPDGRQIVYAANGEKGSQLWLRSFDSVAARPLAGTELGAFPFWSPDSRSIAFFADSKLKRLDLAAGVPQVITDATGAGARGGTWNQDGVIVYAVSGFRTGGLMRVSAKGGDPVPVTHGAAFQTTHSWPQFLRDGRRLIFFVASNQASSSGEYLVSLDGGEPTKVLSSQAAAMYDPSGYLLYVSEGVLMAQAFDESRGAVSGEPAAVAKPVGANDGSAHSGFWVSPAGVLAHRPGTLIPRQLTWFDRTGKSVGTVGPVDENTPFSPSLARDGRRIVTTRTVQGNPDLWLIEADRGVFTRFTFDPAADISPLWSADGTQIVFRSSRRGVSDLFIKPASGVAEEQPLLVTPEGKMPVDWSRDGRLLMFTVDSPKTGADLWVMPMTGDRKPYPILETRFDESMGQFSPDGRWFSYTSNESGRLEIYVRSFPETGGKWQVSTAGGTASRWSADGKELFYLELDGRLMSAPTQVAPDGKSLNAGAPVPLFMTRLATGAGAGIGGGPYARANYAVSPDGRFLMNVDTEKPVTSPMTIVLNWSTELKIR